jgi:DNA polymerase-3 subunit delta
MPPSAKNFTFVCGQDDYLVGRAGQERYLAATAEVTDEFAREVISGYAANVEEVETAVNRFREAVQTVPLFGGRRVVWLKDVNFFADTVTGRAEGTLRMVEDLQRLLEAVQPAETGVLITAAPVDRRRSFLKWCEKHADFVLAGGEPGDDALAGVALAEARGIGASFAPGAINLLLAKVGANTRLLVEEVRKLAAYAADRPIAEADVAALTANTAEGEFFESAEAFFSGDLGWTIDALHRHFFTGGDARPILSALQNRNRLLLQVRTLVDAGEASVGPRGLSGLAEAAAVHRARFGEAAAEKSSYNVFSQNAWYLGKVIAAAKLPSLRRLIDNQREFIAAFEEILRRPAEQEDVLRDLSLRCVG